MWKRGTRIKRFGKYLQRNWPYVLTTSIGTLFLALFIMILRSLEPEEFLDTFDRKTTTLLISKRTALLNMLMKLMTTLGSKEVIISLLLIVSSYLYKRKHWNTLVAFAVCIGGGQMFVSIAKLFVKRERPDFINRLMKENTYSFPSGHTFMSVVTYGFLVYITLQTTSSNLTRILSVISGLMLILGIGFSRIYLGVHWFSDVLGSFAAGSSWITLSLTLLEAKRKYDLMKSGI